MSQDQDSECREAQATLAAAKHVHDEQTALYAEALTQRERAERDLTDARIHVLKLSGVLRNVEWSLQILADESSNPVEDFVTLIPYTPSPRDASDPRSLTRLHQSIAELFEMDYHDGVVLSNGSSGKVTLRVDDSDVCIIVPDQAVVPFVQEWQLTVRLKSRDLEMRIASIRAALSRLEVIKEKFGAMQSKLAQARIPDVPGAGS